MAVQCPTTDSCKAKDNSDFGKKLKTRESDICIVQVVSDPADMQIEASINLNQWYSDVNAVNNLLETASNTPTNSLSAAASSALTNAQDELCQLSTLRGILDGDSQAITCATADVMTNFETHVVDHLNAIVSDPYNTTAVDAAISDINPFHCCSIPIDVGFLWLDAADSASLVRQVPITASRPQTCQAVHCSAVTSC